MNLLVRIVTSRAHEIRRPARLFVLTAALCFASAGAAQEADVDCDEAFTTVAMMTCLGWDIEAAEASLRDALAAQRQALDEPGLALLEASQNAWEVFRDAECERARDVVRGGTMGPLIAGACILDMTRSRAREITDAAQLAAESETVFWRDTPPLVGEFHCEGHVEARVGLVPGFEPDVGPSLAVRVQVGSASVDFPVGTGTQDAVCGADVWLSPEPGDTCPAIRLDDGLCDAFTISWDPDTRQLRWTRR